MQNEQAPDASASGGGVGDVIVNIDKQLGMLAQAASQSQAMPPGVAEKLQSIRQQFSDLVDSLTQGAPQSGGGAVAPEQGGSNAVPMTMERA